MAGDLLIRIVSASSQRPRSLRLALMRERDQQAPRQVLWRMRPESGASAAFGRCYNQYLAGNPVVPVDRPAVDRAGHRVAGWSLVHFLLAADRRISLCPLCSTKSRHSRSDLSSDMVAAPKPKSPSGALRLGGINTMDRLRSVLCIHAIQGVSPLVRFFIQQSVDSVEYARPMPGIASGRS